VYRIVAPGVAVDMVTCCTSEYVPPNGANSGTAATSTYVAAATLLSGMPVFQAFALNVRL
jgi:hypothetical protein